jgi:sirohydrochlorin cobaltochelatase
LKRAVILLAHGSRDPQWRRPIERLCRALRAQLNGVRIAPAYLESMRPDLAAQVGALVRLGCRQLTIVPVFIGTGRHLRRDLARQVKALGRRHPGARFKVERAIGEQPSVLAAIAAAIAAGIPSPRGSARRS